MAAENSWGWSGGFGYATADCLNLERRGTVELDPTNTDGWKGWVRYPRDDGKWAWISQTEVAKALEGMEDDQATWLEGRPSPAAIYCQQGRALEEQRRSTTYYRRCEHQAKSHREVGWFFTPCNICHGEAGSESQKRPERQLLPNEPCQNSFCTCTGHGPQGYRLSECGADTCDCASHQAVLAEIAARSGAGGPGAGGPEPEGEASHSRVMPEGVSGKSRQKKRKASSDDPNDVTDRYYLNPEIIWWFTENLPNRFKGCRTWRDLVAAALNGQLVRCLAEGCGRDWKITSEHDQNSCLMSMWSHMDAKAENEANDFPKWHATQHFMQQLLACYKREQLAELERIQAAEGKQKGASEGKGAASSSSSGPLQQLGPPPDVMGFAPPANIIQQGANKPGAWTAQGGWGGASGGRF